jgi:hypothetical protein
MNRNYFDIIDRIGTPPVWWQAGGVPRYNSFHPEESTGVYASEAALVEVATQDCETTFLVLFENSNRSGEIANNIRNEALEYGDPPNVYCCNGACTSMLSVAIRVLEYWRKGGPTGGSEYIEDGFIIDAAYSEWRRDPALEVVFQEPWGGGGPTPPTGPRWVPAAKR